MISSILNRLVIAGAMAALSAGSLSADVPDLEEPLFIQNGGEDLTVDYCSVPCVVDWDNDGKKDLLVGQLIGGHVKLFLNRGTDLNPHFDGWSYVESEGSPLSADWG